MIPTMIQTWTQHNPNMTPQWAPHDFNMIPSMIQNKTQKWNHDFLQMTSTRLHTPRKLFRVVDNLWATACAWLLNLFVFKPRQQLFWHFGFAYNNDPRHDFTTLPPRTFRRKLHECIPYGGPASNGNSCLRSEADPHRQYRLVAVYRSEGETSSSGSC